MGTTASASAVAAVLILAGLGGACQASAADGDSSTRTAPAVTVKTDALRYRPGQTIVVTIRNGLATPIVATTGQASCTIVSLDRRVGRRWVEVRNCFAGVPPVQVRIAAGATTRVRLRDRLQLGAYRARLEYRLRGRDAEARSRTVQVTG